jgi:hypothetical protein
MDTDTEDTPEPVSRDPAYAAKEAWDLYRGKRLQCYLCDGRHTYGAFITAHGYVSPPLQFARLVRERLRADEAYQAWLQEQREAARGKASQSRRHPQAAERAKVDRERPRRNTLPPGVTRGTWRKRPPAA